MKEDDSDLGVPHVLFRFLDGFKTKTVMPDKFGYVRTRAHTKSTPYQWFDGLLEGKHQIELAWQAGGSGLAKNVTREGWSPLSCALINKQGDTATLILQKKPHIDNLTKQGMSEFHFACILGDE